MTPLLPTTSLSGAASASGSVTRRELLASLGGATAVSGTRRDTAAADQSVDDTTVRIRVYPRPLPLWAWLRYGFDGFGTDWPPPFRDALAAVADAFEQVLEYARERSRLAEVSVRVEPGPLLRLPLSTPQRPSDTVVPSLESLLAGFRTRLRERDAFTGSTCHLLLCWEPLNYRIGYGGTLSPHAMVGAASADSAGGHVGDALTVANLGATEIWDSRAVTRNIAIHETLHTFLSDEVVAAVAGAGTDTDTHGGAASDCDHHLGTARRTDRETLEISPMATAYAGPEGFDGGTRFHGTGCYDRDRFHRHDGLEDVDRWQYTGELSPATLEAVTRYLERRFGS